MSHLLELVIEITRSMVSDQLVIISGITRPCDLGWDGYELERFAGALEYAFSTELSGQLRSELSQLQLREIALYFARQWRKARLSGEL